MVSLAYVCFALLCVAVVAQEVAEGPADGFVRGPGGAMLHPSCHVELPSGAAMIDNERIMLEDGTVVPIPPCDHQAPAQNTTLSERSLDTNKRTPNGWNLYSRYFFNQYIGDYNGDWVVPPAPVGGYRGQLLYIFTGLQSAECGCILQPVIWWGISPAGGGNNWYAAVWYVYANNQQYTTSAVVRINTGDYISTYMHRVTGAGWDCGMSANGQLVTAARFPDTLQSNAYCTLEVYNTATCDSLPSYTTTTFQNLAISQQGAGWIAFNNALWNIYTPYSDCYQSMSCDGNRCAMSYGAWYPCPANSGETLYTSQSLRSDGVSALVSSGCGYRMFIQGDGNLVVYNAINTPLWNSGTNGVGVAPFILVMQGDGNLVVYDARGVATWNSQTPGVGVYPFRLVMQGDYNLVIYDGNNSPTWWSKR